MPPAQHPSVNRNNVYFKSMQIGISSSSNGQLKLNTSVAKEEHSDIHVHVSTQWLPLPPISCVSLGKTSPFPVPQFPHLHHEVGR